MVITAWHVNRGGFGLVDLTRLKMFNEVSTGIGCDLFIYLIGLNTQIYREGIELLEIRIMHWICEVYLLNRVASNEDWDCMKSWNINIKTSISVLKWTLSELYLNIDTENEKNLSEIRNIHRIHDIFILENLA